MFLGLAAVSENKTPMKQITFFLKCYLSLMITIFTLGDHSRVKNVLLWPAVFDDGLATAAVHLAGSSQPQKFTLYIFAEAIKP